MSTHDAFAFGPTTSLQTSYPHTLDILSALRSLQSLRPVFHSEADFQHALAWRLQNQNPDCHIRLEVPLYGLAGRGSLDITVREGQETTAIELKYFKAALQIEHAGEQFSLPDNVARDLLRYHYCKDIARLEHAIATSQAQQGYAIVLTNDPRVWRAASRTNICHDFRLDDQRELMGELIWGDRSKQVEAHPPIALKGCYSLSWLPYSNLGTQKGEFRMLVVTIT